MKRTHKNISRGCLTRWCFVLMSFCLALTALERILSSTRCDRLPRRRESIHGHVTDGLAKRIEVQETLDGVLASQFNIVFRNVSKEFKERTKSLVYRCDDKCELEGKYEYGLLSSYLLSVITNRSFAVLSTHCSVISLYDSNIVHWKFDDMGDINGKRLQDVLPWKQRFMTEKKLFEEHLETLDFNKAFPGDIALMHSNFDWMDIIRRQKFAYSEIPWIKTIRSSDLTRLLNVGLFSVPKNVKDGLNMQLLYLMGNDKLVCFHGHPQFDGIFKVFKHFNANYKSGFKMYLSGKDTNCANVSSHISNDLPMVTLNLDGFETQKRCPSSFKEIVDSHVLRLCHVLVTMNSPIGIRAAVMRGTSSGLFCCSNTGVIYPCTHELIANSFRDYDKDYTPLDLDYMVARKTGFIKVAYLCCLLYGLYGLYKMPELLNDVENRCTHTSNSHWYPGNSKTSQTSSEDEDWYPNNNKTSYITLQDKNQFSMFRHDELQFSMNIARTQQKVDEEQFRNFPNYQNASKHVVYFCDSRCGGYADRIKGLIKTYILSVLSQRRFSIHWVDPCPLEHFFQPNLLNWTIDPADLNNLTSKHVEYKDVHQLINFIYERDDVDPKKVFSKDVIYLKANQDWTDMFRKLSVTPLRFPDLYKFPSCDITRIIYHGLFKPSDQLKAVTDKLFEDEIRGKKIACFHARMGEQKHKRYTMNQINPVFEFLKQFNTSEYRIMVASDNGHVKEYAKEMFRGNLIDTNGPLLHIDAMRNNRLSKELKCAGFMRVLIDHAVLTHCDQLVLTNSGYGVLAGQLRHTSRGLHVYFNTHGVFPVRRETLRQAFQYPCLGAPIGVDTICDG